MPTEKMLRQLLALSLEEKIFMNVYQIAIIADCLIGFPDLCESCDYDGKGECGIDCEAGLAKWLESEYEND